MVEKCFWALYLSVSVLLSVTYFFTFLKQIFNYVIIYACWYIIEYWFRSNKHIMTHISLPLVSRFGCSSIERKIFIYICTYDKTSVFNKLKMDNYFYKRHTLIVGIVQTRGVVMQTMRKCSFILIHSKVQVLQDKIEKWEFWLMVFKNNIENTCIYIEEPW